MESHLTMVGEDRESMHRIPTIRNDTTVHHHKMAHHHHQGHLVAPLLQEQILQKIGDVKLIVVGVATDVVVVAVATDVAVAATDVVVVAAVV